MLAAVIHVITKMELGGAQENTLYTCAHLDREKFKPLLCTGPDGPLLAEARAVPGLAVEIIPDLERPLRPLPDGKALAELTTRLYRFRQAVKLPVIVHTHSSKAGILGRLAAVGAGVEIIVHSIHGFGFQAVPALFKPAMLLAERAAAKMTDHFIAVSEANRQQGIGLNLFPPERCTVIHSGIPIAEFTLAEDQRRELRKSLRAELGVTGQAPVVGMIACFKPQKAPEDFVELAAQVIRRRPAACFYMAGDGELRPQVERAIARHRLNDRFRLLGWRRDMPRLLAGTDVLVLTSRWEGLPRVFPQAMAAGVPVVATAVDGGPEAVVHGVNGYLFPVGDLKAMAEAVVELAGNRRLRESMGAAGKLRVSAWDIDQMVRDQEELYVSLLRKKRLIPETQASSHAD